MISFVSALLVLSAINFGNGSSSIGTWIGVGFFGWSVVDFNVFVGVDFFVESGVVVRDG